MARRPNDEWKNFEYDLLLRCVLDSVSAGGSVTDGCRIFASQSKVRDAASARYRWTVRLSKEYAQQYEEAKLKGEAARAKGVEPPIVPIDDESPNQMTSTEFIRYMRKVLRTVEITDGDAEELRIENEALKGELTEIKRELATIKAERDQLLAAMQLARKYAVSETLTVKTDASGVVDTIKD